jgi:hypothetical protein
MLNRGIGMDIKGELGRIALLFIGVTLGGCQQADTHKGEIDDLLLRVRVLEQGQQDIVKEMRANQAKVAVAPKPEAMTFELLGASRAGERRLYPTLARCQAAQQVLVDERAASDAESRAQGAVFINHGGGFSCIPV